MFRNLWRGLFPAKPKAMRRRPPLALEFLEDRAAPVVGATVEAAPVLRGDSFDGVVRLDTSGRGAGSGSLLFDEQHILTAVHIVLTSRTTPTGFTEILALPMVVTFELTRM